MHPADVESFVAEEVDKLRGMLAERPQLGEIDVQLEGTDLYLIFRVRQHDVAQVDPQLATELGDPRRLLIAGPPGVIIQQPIVVPLLGSGEERELILYLHCSDFDSKPPLAELLRLDRTPLPANEWGKDTRLRGIVQHHPTYRRNFFCRPGFREFHELDEHADEPWDAIRETTTLGWLAVTLLHDLKTRWTLQ